jgi:hypothetical protein
METNAASERIISAGFSRVFAVVMAPPALAGKANGCVRSIPIKAGTAD